MCGFVGAFAPDGSIQERLPRLQAGLSAIRHRGPDATSAVADEQVYLGHNRLSIIDLSDAANQPLRAANANAWIVFNGEIYNFEELRATLDEVVFATHSDTEVLLQGYLTQGIEFFSRLRGMYAFAILDRRSRPQLVLGRDPAGIKPLYYCFSRGAMIFGSEVKALVPAVREHLTLNEAALKVYLNLGYCPEPHTIYREIEAMPPGHVLVSSDQSRRLQPFRQYVFGATNDRSARDNEERTSELLGQAVARNLVADVNTAVALSGGIDSSLIYAYANRADARIEGLTVEFRDPQYDEAEVARRYAQHLGGAHRVLPIEPDFTLDTLNQLLLHFDQPFADSSAVPVYYLTRCTREHSKVLLGGDGGDELFDGYPALARLPAIGRARRLLGDPLLANVLSIARAFADADASRSLARAMSLMRGEPADMLFDWLSWCPRQTQFNGRSPFKYDPDDGVAVYRKIWADAVPAAFDARLVFEHFTRQMLGDYLRKTDMMSMLNGVEYRVPLLDEDLVAFALTLPRKQKSSFRRAKKMLRALHGNVYPAETSRAPKKGFSIPLDTYLSGNDLAEMRSLVLAQGSLVRSYVEEDYLRFVFDTIGDAARDRRQASREGGYQRALLFYSLELWHRYGSAAAAHVSNSQLSYRALSSVN